MNYAERIAELEGLRGYPVLCTEGPATVIVKRIAELQRAWDADDKRHSKWDGYHTNPPGSSVTRIVGPLHIGLVIDPTSADVDRCFFIHGVPGDREPMVLVQWGMGGRSWEYTKDLRIIPEDESWRRGDL